MLLSPEAAGGAGLQRLIDSRPGALAATYPVADSESGRTILREVAAAGIPVLVNGSNVALAAFDRVVSAHAHGASELVRWLVSQGRRRILRFWRFTDEPDWLVQRNIGFDRTTAELGLEMLPAVRTLDIVQGDHVREEFDHVRQVMAGYLLDVFRRDPAIDAIMVATDFHAYQVNAALRMIGKQPGRDVLVVGYDNLYADHSCRQWEPIGPAATIDKDNKLIAEAMARLLHGRVTGSLVEGPQLRSSLPRLIVPPSYVS
jgi:DNA-binding LacI/PurR family transcriptional regulator